MGYQIEAYHEEQTLEFGQYAGKSIRQVSDINPAYIEWCILNLDHFYLMTHVCELLKLQLSEPVRAALKEKSKKLDEQIAREYNLTCADGYGKHEFNEEGVCYSCGFDKYEPDQNDEDRGNSYEEERDELDRWNDEAMSGGLRIEYDDYGTDDDW
jgi:hypothetical protein